MDYNFEILDLLILAIRIHFICPAESQLAFCIEVIDVGKRQAVVITLADKAFALQILVPDLYGWLFWVFSLVFFRHQNDTYIEVSLV